MSATRNEQTISRTRKLSRSKSEVHQINDFLSHGIWTPISDKRQLRTTPHSLVSPGKQLEELRVCVHTGDLPAEAWLRTCCLPASAWSQTAATSPRLAIAMCRRRNGPPRSEVCGQQPVLDGSGPIRPVRTGRCKLEVFSQLQSSL